MWSQCTFWCSVLSDSPTVLTVGGQTTSLNAPSGAQCFPTVERSPAPAVWGRGLNAPSGAQCFPTSGRATVRLPHTVSMHLLVLSAFRLGGVERRVALSQGSQCTFWCSVLSDKRTRRSCHFCGLPSQCTFWCSVLSDGCRSRAGPRRFGVSMHLLVLSAFRLHDVPIEKMERERSQCTFWCSVLSDRCRSRAGPRRFGVSMHLLVLSAFRLDVRRSPHGLLSVSMHLLVLSAFRLYNKVVFPTWVSFKSQCTFWCSVLSDRTAPTTAPSSPSLNAPSGAQCFPTAKPTF